TWHDNKFLNPKLDGAVLPILLLNGYKISAPTVLARIPQAELEALLIGYGYKPYFVEGYEPAPAHQRMAAVLDEMLGEIKRIQQAARDPSSPSIERPRWPMLVLRVPKGWTGPKEINGKPVEGSFRSHQVPFSDMDHPESVKRLESWMKSYKPEELFDEA